MRRISLALVSCGLIATAATMLYACKERSSVAFAKGTGEGAGGCGALPDQAKLAKALAEVSASGNAGIFTPNMMWATLVDRAGIVCAVAKTGDAWPGSRAISAQKASTANAFSNKKLALSTANLFSAVQPGGSLFGLQHSNPVNVLAAYAGDAGSYGTTGDALVGQKIGGVNVFGGGLAIYDQAGNVIGAIGVSGDTSCTDHIIAWRTRTALGFAAPGAGVSPTKDDNIIFDINGATSAGGFGHPACSPEAKRMAEGLPSEK